MVKHKINLRMMNQGAAPIINLVQNDTGREVECNILDFEIPEGATSKLWLIKPSGKVASCSGIIFGSTVTITLTDQAVAEDGMSVAQLKINKDGKTVSSFLMYFTFEADTSKNGVISKDDIKLVETFIQEQKKALDAYIAEKTQDIDGKLNKQQWIENANKYLKIDETGNVVPADAPSGGSGFSGNYNDLTNRPTIPSRLSEMVEDETHRVVSDTEKQTWNEKANKSEIPNALPNPHSITFTGAVTGSYDGREPLNIDIPVGGGGNVTPEQIQSAVDEYLDQNPVQPTKIDETLTQKGQASDAKVTGDELRAINDMIAANLGENVTVNPPPQTSVNLFDAEKAEKGYYDVNTGAYNANDGYRTITLPYQTTDIIRKSKDVEWFSTWILLLDSDKQPILSKINVLSGNNFTNPGWDEWKMQAETLLNEPKYQNARYVKVCCSIFGETKDFNKFMVTVNNPLPEEYVPPASDIQELKSSSTQKFVYSSILDEHIRTIVNSGSSGNLDGKTILFVGDSIVAGFVQEQGLPNYGKRNGFVEMLQSKYPKAVIKNLAAGGATIAHYENEATKCVLEQIRSAISQYPNADYIVIQGGVNDTWMAQQVGLGEISAGYTASLNESTFCGALESIMKQAVTRWTGKKIGFLTTHKIPGAPNLGQYMEKAKEICKKWSIPYLDLFTESTINYTIESVKKDLSYRTADYPNGDGTHPNEACYEQIFVPKIEKWLIGL